MRKLITDAWNGVITLFKLQKSSVEEAYNLGYNNALRDMRLHLDDEIRER